jgi:pimeloyl-ACP methyl ester carboxylesterase
MNRKIVLSLIVSMLVMAFGVFAVNAQDTATGQYAEVNGVNLYYEIHGTGEPLIVLHGGLGGIPEFGQLIPLLAESRQVIAVEMQGHAHTADIDRALSYENLANDVAALIEHLGLEKADILGFSLGGGVALRTAIQHPEVVNHLIVISAPFRREDMYAEFRTGMEAMNAEAASFMLETPMYALYAATAPNVDDWATLIGKVGDMMRQDYDWSSEVAGITAPTLMIVGDSDMLNPAHAVELFELLGGGVPGDFAGMPNAQLAVLPGTSHFTMLSRTDLLLPVILPFLDAPVTAVTE